MGDFSIIGVFLLPFQGAGGYFLRSFAIAGVGTGFYLAPKSVFMKNLFRILLLVSFFYFYLLLLDDSKSTPNDNGSTTTALTAGVAVSASIAQAQ